MPFNLRNFEDEKKAKMGVMECVNHKLIEPFQVLFEKTGKLFYSLFIIKYISLCNINNFVYFR